MSNSKKNANSANVSRRDFLAVGGVSLVGLSMREAAAARKDQSRAVIQIVMNGGASPFETFDPKPEAVREIRGPIRAIETKVPGVHFAESLPRLAERADQLVVVRSFFHEATPIHETGMQLLLTGSLVKKNQLPPHVGFVVDRCLPPSNVPTSMEVGGPLKSMGVNAYRGDESGILETEQTTNLLQPADLLAMTGKELCFAEATQKTKESYGSSQFAESMWTAARLVEQGIRHVTVHTFSEFEGQVTWDAHGDLKSAPGTIFDYRDTIVPQFDRAVSGLLDDLKQSGLIDRTLIVTAGEMGRTATINSGNGRDHCTNVWSGFLAGGGLNGGQVIGASNADGTEILDQPINISQLPTLMCNYLGIAPGTELKLHDGTVWHTPEAPLVLA